MSDHKFFGLYRGLVHSVNDPLNKGRLQIRIPQLFGDSPTDWVWPVQMPNTTIQPPAVGQGVWVSFLGGDPAFPIWLGKFGDELTDSYPWYISKVAPEEVVPQITDLLELRELANGKTEVDLTQTILNIVRNRCYGSFYSTQTITAAINTVQYFPFEQTAFSCGNVSVTNNNQLRLVGTGVFDVQFSAQFTSTVSAQHDVDIWLVKNGTNVPYSNTRISLVGNGVDVVPAWNFFIEGGGPTDYWQIAWSTDSDKIILHSEGPQTNPTRPGIPSVIMTVNKVK